MVSFDVERARRDTPGCQQTVHFNNAGSALMPDSVLHSTIAHLELESRIGGYEAAARANDALEGVYVNVGRLIGCQPKEVAIVENATRAWDMVFYAIPFESGDRVITCRSEYASNYIAFQQRAATHGITIDVVPNDEAGAVDVGALLKMLDDRVRLVAISHIPTNGGLVNPAEAIGQVVAPHRALFLLDACQSVGQRVVDVGAIQCDMLSATSRKYLRGPRGMGFLYVRGSLIKQLDPPFLDLHAAVWTGPDTHQIRDDAKRFETWETNVAAKVGFNAALEYALTWQMSKIQDRVQSLANRLRERLAEMESIKVQDLGTTRSGIVSFTHDTVAPERIKEGLAAHNVNISVSPLVYTPLDMTDRRLPSIARASVHYYNTDDEVDRFAALVQGIIR